MRKQNIKQRNRQRTNAAKQRKQRRAKRNRLVVAVSWDDEDGPWNATVDAKTTFTVSRDDLLNGKFFRKWDRPGTLVTKESMLLSVYKDDEDQCRLSMQADRAGWDIRLLSDEQASEAEAEFRASRNAWKRYSEPMESFQDDLKNDNIYYNDEDLCFVLEQALEYPNLKMVAVQAADSGRGIFFGHSDRKPTTKEIGCITCATDKQMLMLQEKYQRFVLDRDVVDARIYAN
jgi:hypothetical protein